MEHVTISTSPGRGEQICCHWCWWRLLLVPESWFHSISVTCSTHFKALITAVRQRCAANPFTEESDRRDKEASRDII